MANNKLQHISINEDTQTSQLFTKCSKYNRGHKIKKRFDKVITGFSSVNKSRHNPQKYRLKQAVNELFRHSTN